MRRLWKVPLAIAGVALFVVALKLMQSGARAVAPLIEARFDVDTLPGALGLGWTASYVLLSGSPVAAMAVTFLDAGQIDGPAAFAMITGSRLGAAFIVLVLGFFYVLYHREPTRDLRIGLLALIVTAAIYLPACALGYALLRSGALDGWGAGGSALAGTLDGGPLGWISEALRGRLPPWGLFIAGLALIIGSFKLLDLSLPSVEEGNGGDDGNGEESRLRRWVHRRWPMFGIGAAVTLLTLSVSVSLGLLVPLHDRRLIRAKQAVPYIMGANITTFVDTLVAAMAMERGTAMVVVAVEMVAVTVVSLVVLVACYGPFEKAVLAVVDGITSSRRNLIVCVVVLVALPVTLLVAPRLF